MNLDQDPPTASAKNSPSAGDIASSLSQTKHTLVEAAQGALAQGRKEGERLIEEKKEAIAGRMGRYSSALEDSAKNLEDEDPNIALFAHRAADRMQTWAGYVRKANVASLREDATELAKRQPLIFFGGLFVAGVIIGNVIKSSHAKSTGVTRKNAAEPAHSSGETSQIEVGSPGNLAS